MRLFLFACAAVFLFSCGGKNAEKQTFNVGHPGNQECAMMKFEQTSSDFGEVAQGEKVVLFYTFENAGGSDLVIYEAIPSCGCTSPKFDESPVKPGEKRTVEVTFDSDGWSGKQQKSITFKTNGVPDYTTILLSGTVTSFK